MAGPGPNASNPCFQVVSFPLLGPFGGCLLHTTRSENEPDAERYHEALSFIKTLLLCTGHGHRCSYTPQAEALLATRVVAADSAVPHGRAGRGIEGCVGMVNSVEVRGVSANTRSFWGLGI